MPAMVAMQGEYGLRFFALDFEDEDAVRFYFDRNKTVKWITLLDRTGNHQLTVSRP
jgi:hypothetical protein